MQKWHTLKRQYQGHCQEIPVKIEKEVWCCEKMQRASQTCYNPHIQQPRKLRGEWDCSSRAHSSSRTWRE